MAEYDSKIQIARDTMEEILKIGETFSYEEARDKIVSNGGVLRMSPGYTLGMFLEKQEDRGVIRYNANLDKFEIYKTLN